MPQELRYAALTPSELGTLVYWMQRALALSGAPERVQAALDKLDAARSKRSVPLVDAEHDHVG